MFYIFTNPALAPLFRTDSAVADGDEEFLECKSDSDMWRVSTRGMATLFRRYWEDTWLGSRSGLNAGSWLSPNFAIQMLAEFIRHGRAFAERFGSPISISFRCEWRGLRGRQPKEPMVSWDLNPPSRTDQCVATGSVHTQTIESFWSLLKRGIMGSFHHVTREYLPLYVNEFAFRFNGRNDPALFRKLLQTV